MSPSISIIVVTVVTVVWMVRKLVILLVHGKDLVPYPPGPKPKPLIGNMFDFPVSKAAQNYMEWEKKYNSAILHAQSLRNHVVVINSLEDAVELFETRDRARIYSDRPTIPIFKLMGWEYNFGFLTYGDQWRKRRRICQQNFSPQGAQQYENIQTNKTRQLLQGLLNTPEEFDGHNKLFAISLAMSMMYGYEVKSIEDPVIKVADEALRLGISLIGPDGSFMNIIPALQYIPIWFPGASSHKKANKVRILTEEMMRIPAEFVKKSFKEGTVISSLVTDFYERKYTIGATQEEEEIIKSVAYTVYGGASDTITSATGTFFYTMAINRHVQRKAQAEIDLIVGSKRLPTLADRESLPYIEAVYREVMRFMPPVPLGVPHRLVEDDFYKGYFIPKGATILANIWAMTHNEEIYPDPYTFKPERFFDDSGKLNDDSRVLAYGFGRRVCVGKHVASTTMWLLIASVLACFNIEKSKDEDGNEIEINDDYDDNNFFNHKYKFMCSFRPRSLAARKLIVDDA